MKRVTTHLDSEPEILLKLEALRQKRPTVEVIREALRSHLLNPGGLSPGGGAFDSGHTDTAERAEELLGKLGFGES